MTGINAIPLPVRMWGSGSVLVIFLVFYVFIKHAQVHKIYRRRGVNEIIMFARGGGGEPMCGYYT